MKPLIRQLFDPLLQLLENQEGAYEYKSSHRTILKVVGLLFWCLSGLSLTLTLMSGLLGGIVPSLIFFIIGLVCEVVGFLGSDKAVAKIWRNR